MATSRQPALAPWRIERGQAGFPPALERAAQPPAALYGLGDVALLDQPLVALVSSVQCAGSLVMQTFDAVRGLRDAGAPVAGGFHSPLERECLDFLLRGDQPLVVALAKGLAWPRLPAAWRVAVDAGRLLVVTPFNHDVRRTTSAQARARNRLICELAAAVLIPHAAPGGDVERLAGELAARGGRLFTFADEANERLTRWGARPFCVADVCAALRE